MKYVPSPFQPPHADQAPKQVITVNGRIIAAPQNGAPQAQPLADAMQASFKTYSEGVLDPAKDELFLRGNDEMCQYTALRAGCDPLAESPGSFPRGELVAPAWVEIITSEPVLATEVRDPLGRLDIDGVKRELGQLELVERALESHQGTVDQLTAQRNHLLNRLGKTATEVYGKYGDLINNHAVLFPRTKNLRELSVGAANKAAETRVKNERRDEKTAAKFKPADKVATPPVRPAPEPDKA